MAGKEPALDLEQCMHLHWGIACWGVGPMLTQSIEAFCRNSAGYVYLGAAFSPQAPPPSAVPVLLFCSTRWLDCWGHQTLHSIHEVSPACRILLVGQPPQRLDLSQLLRHGVCGLLKADPGTAEEVEKVIRAVTAGQLWFSRAELSEIVFRLEATLENASSETSPDLPTLTPRENIVLHQVQLGRSNKEIARSLGIAEHTVKIHLQHVFQKLRLHRRTELLLMRLKVPGNATAEPPP